MKPYTKRSYDLLHEGVLALAQIEAVGMRVDEAYLAKAIHRTERRINRLQTTIKKTDVARIWKKTFRAKTNLNSNEQLGKILFGVMKYPSTLTTPSGRFKTDGEALSGVDHPFVQDWLRLQTLQKALSTYLKGLVREMKDGYIHPFFHLHTTQTYRSSSDKINFHNQPVRDPKLMRLIRTAFIPREGRQLVEVDYSGLEVTISACYHKDPRMIEYICDPTKDMHRDMAMECYRLPQAEVTKPVRYCGKNMFVFPQFYGDWYIDCARSLWEAIDKMKLQTTSGLPLKAHLAQVGIHSLGRLDPKERPQPGTLEAHIQQVEQRFWKKKFPTYARWKKSWYEAYRQKGWFKTLTGFICQGYMKKNEVINYPVQGSAFHCLLWALIELVKHELKRRRMKTLVVGQIHDSLVADVPVGELEDYLKLAYHVMVTRLMQHWKWICVPLNIEAEVSPPGMSWADVKPMEIPK